MHKKLLSVAMAVALVSGLLALLAPAAQAAAPFDTENFHPDTTPISGTEANHLSDRFDGTDSTAHLTNVSTADADFVTWYDCPDGVGPTLTQSELASCSIVIGTDSTPRTPSGGNQFSPVDEAYDINWDIPGSEDGAVRAIAAVACTGSSTNPPDVEGSDANCVTDVENGVTLDDASTGGSIATQTTAGEIVSLRTRGGSTNGGSAGTCAGGLTAAQCDALFTAFPHGSNIPKDGFTFRATTSEDVTALDTTLDAGDAQTDPNGAASNPGSCAQVTRLSGTNFKMWECSFTAAQIAAAGGNNEYELAIFNTGGGSGACAGVQCQLDAHYVVALDRAPTSVVQTFESQGSPPNPPANTSCTSPDKSEDDTLASTEDVTICMTDNFNDPFVGPVTEEITGPGQFLDCGNLAGATGHDHNSDGSNDHCHGTTNANGQGNDITVGNIDGATPGTVTITSCYDPQNGGTSASPPTNHGCADAGNLKDTLTLTYGARPTEVFIAYTGTGQSTDPCRTGDTFARGEVGAHEDLTVCTFDSQGNPVGTDVDGSRITWTITGAHGNDQVAVRFNPNPPPQETTGAEGQAAVGIDDVAVGDNFITATLLNANGDFVDNFSVEKEVAGRATPRDISSSLNARRSRRSVRFTLTASDHNCEVGRQVTLFMRQRGPDANLGSKTTNQFGKVGFGGLARRHTYYGRAARSNASANNGDPLNCLGAQSNDVRIPKRHRRR